MISVERDDLVASPPPPPPPSSSSHSSSGSGGSGSVRVIPITVEGRAPVQQQQQPIRSSLAAAKEEVQPPWLNSKIIPIHLETAVNGNQNHRPASTNNSYPVATPTPRQQQQQVQQPTVVEQHPPWRTQAAANANQIASMMEE